MNSVAHHSGGYMLKRETVNIDVQQPRKSQLKLNCHLPKASQFKPAEVMKHSCWRRSHKIHFTPKPVNILLKLRPLDLDVQIFINSLQSIFNVMLFWI